MDTFWNYPVLWLVVVAVGFAAGILGGLLGVGGSVVMIPGLTWVVGPAQHVYQAAAMIVNIAVAIPAARRHRQAGTASKAVLKWMLPSAVVFVMMGVAASNLPWFRGAQGGVWLGRVLALFLVYVAAINFYKIVAVQASHTSPPQNGLPPDPEHDPGSGVTPGKASAVGGVMGFVAGLLGIGGGAVAVPLQQQALQLPLRTCIANSSAVMVWSASVGAVVKNATLSQSAPAGTAWWWPVALAALLIPSAWIGSKVGAGLTHRLPLRAVRGVFVLLMIAAAWRMAGFES